ncbi:Clavaminate synthase-like protein [Rhodofomes roseus]|uniref:Clavaminate synthase-like protein n=1 Tax=Rhodofomes roseus TaxID=34475 RepID=A0ABQ8KBV6_9APHY|nr:Clavaminate synthase-like protein [Rhodofomes roseus]KAH9834993.1 Clavaminate synthase-like protein [Rhodofomes roseus]
MPSVALPVIRHYIAAPPTREKLDYADLAILDFSKIGTPEGHAELSVQLRDAMTTNGFFYIVNHGLTQAENDRMFDITDVALCGVPEEEKRNYLANISDGSNEGYKLRAYLHIDGGVRDQFEYYNINEDISCKQHPKAVRPLLPEVAEFAKFNHYRILHPLMRLFALGLELPEDTFVNMHNFEAVGESYVRMMKYYPRSADDEVNAKQVWLKGHTDIGTVTILWSQPVTSLQVLMPDGQWRYVRHIDNALVVNSGDAMEFLSGGFYKPTVHRVVQPPQDQRGYNRLSVIFFAMTDDNVKLVPRAESPVLQNLKHGVQRRWADDADAPTMEAWRKGVTSTYGLVELKKKEDGTEENIVNGIAVKYYS